MISQFPELTLLFFWLKLSNLDVKKNDTSSQLTLQKAVGSIF